MMNHELFEEVARWRELAAAHSELADRRLRENGVLLGCVGGLDEELAMERAKTARLAAEIAALTASAGHTVFDRVLAWVLDDAHCYY